jgi:hypothetical protein
MPMWMQYRFDHGGGSNTGIAALNGIITYGGTDNGVLISDFVKDRMRLHNHVHRHTYRPIAPGRLGRTTAAELIESSVTGYSIVSQVVNDVAMTVLPNAPIDAATGLPVPTIAVATNGGVSVIKDDGTVVDITHTASTNNNADKIDIIGQRLVYSTQQSGSSTNFWRLKFIDIPSGDTTAAYASSLSGYQFDARGTTGFAPALNTDADLNDTHNNIIDFAADKAVGFTNKLTLLQDAASIGGVAVSSVYQDAAVAYVASDYNTGWMNGDIKLATLSDTDDTNITFADKQLIDEPYFNASTGWYFNGNGASGAGSTSGTGWSISGGKITQSGAGGDFYAVIPVVNGRQYVMQLTFDTTGTSSFNNVSWGFRSLANSGYLSVTQNQTSLVGNTANQTKQVFWTADTTGNIIARVYCDAALSIDNFTVHIAEEDRSVNGNGLQVFGTVTKSAVATGAELVSYRGNGYLKQPSVGNLVLANDFSITWWQKHDGVAGVYEGWQIAEDSTSGANAYDQVVLSAMHEVSSSQYLIRGNNITGAAVTNGIASGSWTCLTITKEGSTIKLYTNGELSSTTTGTTAAPSNPYSLQLLRWQYGATVYSTTNSELALFRTSGTVPSPEQIKKIYNDEKFLFQENAKATLYGASDAVTALAYDDDTELLHAGTSAGRSVFQGLRRIDNTTDAVGAAISASNGMVAED